jgi:quercetin dioxygenase-like cupin family protein
VRISFSTGVFLVPDAEAIAAGQKPRSGWWQDAITVLQEVGAALIPAAAHAMTVIVEFPPGDPGSAPRRHCGPRFGYLLAGEMVFELEGEPGRVRRPGEALREPGGDVIHHQNGSNRDDVAEWLTVTMLCEPAKPTLTLAGGHELARRGNRRAPRAT